MTTIGITTNFPYSCESINSCKEYQTYLLPGKYKFQVWGAQGGSILEGIGGKGGYSEGIITLYKITNIFVHIGVNV